MLSAEITVVRACCQRDSCTRDVELTVTVHGEVKDISGEEWEPKLHSAVDEHGRVEFLTGRDLKRAEEALIEAKEAELTKEEHAHE